MVVYKKTEKGMNELLAQSPGINARLVSVLVLVDGIRDSSEVIRLAKEAGLPVDALEILLHGGFIDKKFKGSVDPAAMAFELPAKPMAPAPKQSDAASKFKGFNALYVYLVEQTKALLGLRGFIYQLRIERATTVLELKALIEPLTQLIAKKHGFQVAQEFMRESERLVVAAIAERNI
ncbi:hypothetical protein BH10PSE16_BH10PSE16_35490 [soil metagenome]